MESSLIARGVSRTCKQIGRTVARSPGYFMIFPIFITAILSTSLPSAVLVTNPDYLYTIGNSKSKLERDFIENTYVQNISGRFDIRRTTRTPRGLWLIATAIDGGTVLKKDVFRELATVDRTVQRLVIRLKRKWSYSDLCAKVGKDCFQNTILSLAPRMKAIEDGRRQLRYPFDSESMVTAAHLGGVVTDDQGYIETAKAVALFYFLDDADVEKERRAILWEHEIMKTLSNKSFQNITLFRLATSSFENELHGVVMHVLKLCIPLVITMVTLAVITSATMNCGQSMPFCAALGCLSSSLAVISAFGIIIYSHGIVADVCMSVPFLTMGVGMDDTFVVLAAWRRTDPKKSIEDRLGEAYSESAVSITITSLTNFLTFCIGLTSSYNAIRLFCLYASVSVLFTYLYQMTFFGSCLAINAYLDCYRVINTKKQGKTEPYIPKPLKHKDHLVALLFKNHLAPCLTKHKIIACVFMLYCTYMGFSIWGCTKLQKTIDYSNCFPSDSYITKFYRNYDSYFTRYRETIQVVIDKPLNYSNATTQVGIESMLKELESSEYVADSSLTESWLRAYLQFLKLGWHYIQLRGYDLRTERGFIDALQHIFLAMPEAYRFKQDIIFDNNGTTIVSSRFLLMTNLTGTSVREANMVSKTREIIRKYKYPSFVFGSNFVHYEQHLTVEMDTVKTICITTAVVMFVFLMFLPNVICILSAGIVVASIEVGAVGFMSFWNVRLDALCMLNLMLCIGYSIDYAAHITHFYVLSKEHKASGRIRDSLYSAGLPVLQCSVSTLAGVLVLSFAPAQMFIIFVKLVVLVILFSTAHSLFVLPLLLSLWDLWKRTKVKKNTTVSEH